MMKDAYERKGRIRICWLKCERDVSRHTSGFFEYELYVVFGLLLGMERTISVVVR